MAKAKQNQKNNKQKKKTGRRTRVRQRVGQMGVSKQDMYANLLIHPDSAVVPSTGVYDGELGCFQRFVTTTNLNGGAGQTSGFLAFCPATGNLYTQADASSATALSFSVTNTGAPGATFLNANAYKVRGVACKLELSPSGSSITNITGEVAVGVTTGGSFVTTLTSVNHLFDIAKAFRPIERKLTVSRWFPGSLDHTYQVYNNTPSEDVNWVYIAYRNAPAGVAIPLRITYVCEYTVKNTIGIAPSGAVSNPIGHNAVVHQMQSRDPHWHHSVLDELKHASVGIAKDVGTAARYVARHGLTYLGEAMIKSAPRALALM